MLRIRTLILVSCLLSVAAIVCQFVWLKYCGRSMALRSESSTLSVDQRALAIAEADRTLAAAHLFPYVGLAAAIAAWLLAILSRRQDPSATSLPFVLVAGYVLTLLILI